MSEIIQDKKRRVCDDCGKSCSRLANRCKACSTKVTQGLFVDYYRKFGSLGIAAKHAGVKSRRTIYNWMENSPAFAELYQLLKEDRADEIKSKLYQAAMGELDLTGPQVTSAIFLLKAFDPKQFAEKYQVGGIPDQPIEVEIGVKDISDEELIEIIERRRRRGAAEEAPSP